MLVLTKEHNSPDDFQIWQACQLCVQIHHQVSSSSYCKLVSFVIKTKEISYFSLLLSTFERPLLAGNSVPSGESQEQVYTRTYCCLLYKVFSVKKWARSRVFLEREASIYRSLSIILGVVLKLSHTFDWLWEGENSEAPSLHEEEYLWKMVRQRNITTYYSR